MYAPFYPNDGFSTAGVFTNIPLRPIIEAMRKYALLALFVLAALVLGAGAGFYVGIQYERIKAAEKAGGTENPLANIKTNPLENVKTNPFKDVKTNPFE